MSINRSVILQATYIYQIRKVSKKHLKEIHTYTHKKRLNRLLCCSLNDLAEFIRAADSGLMKPVEEGDYDGLVDVMGHLMAVKDRQTTTDEMFDPLKQTIELLKTYDQEMPEEVHMQLQVRKNISIYSRSV